MASTAPPASLRSPAVLHYAEDVVARRVLAGPWVRLACERHLRDLATGHERGLRFDPAKADHALEFFDYLCLFEGQFAGERFLLCPWQAFIVGSLFGWVKANGFRRFRTAYIEIGKGNGKTPMAAAIGLYGIVADDEASAEVYSAATTAAQAGIAFRDAKRMVEASPRLAQAIEVLEHNLACPMTGSYMRVVSSEAKSLDGKRPHIVLTDELHEHSSNQVVAKMTAGFKMRRQPLNFEITNSGFDRATVCWEHHQHSVAVLEGRVTDDAWFAYVCALDKDDDWRDEAVWRKANPNLGVSIDQEYLREEVRKATNLPSEQNLVKRLNFCIWTEQATRWLDMDVWDACAGPVPWQRMAEHCRGRRCVGGLDLANTTDLAALVLVFADDSGDETSYDILPYAWCPEEAVRERSRKAGVSYEVWARDGALIATPGNVIDYKSILKTLEAAVAAYRFADLGYDRWGSTKLVQDLEEVGFDADPKARDRRLTPLGQGFATLSAPTKELEVLVKSGRIRHGGHPVLRWAVGNLVVEQDAAGNLKPTKDKSSEKIDPAVALINAMQRALADDGEGEYSVYQAKELLVL